MAAETRPTAAVFGPAPNGYYLGESHVCMPFSNAGGCRAIAAGGVGGGGVVTSSGKWTYAMFHPNQHANNRFRSQEAGKHAPGKDHTFWWLFDIGQIVSDGWSPQAGLCQQGGAAGRGDRP